MPTHRERTPEEEVDEGVELIDTLLETVEGSGRPTVLDQYDASAVLALIYCQEFRDQVLTKMHSES